MLASISEREGQAVTIQLVLLQTFGSDQKIQGIRIMGSRTGISAQIVMRWQSLNLIKELADRLGIRDGPRAQRSWIWTHLIRANHPKHG